MKGISFDNAQRFVLDRFGEEPWLRVLERVGPDDRLELEGMVSVGWYDVYMYARMIRAIDACCGQGDLRLLPQLGAFAAERDFNRTLRLLLRALNPEAIVHAQRRLWSHFHGAGSWDASVVPTGLRGVLKDWASEPALCQQLVGYLTRLVEFTGGKNVNVLHPECRGEGRPACVFDVQYR
jgi:hypothetical protein